MNSISPEFPINFLLTTPRPPTSPLFPYTTLFRSHSEHAGENNGKTDNRETIASNPLGQPRHRQHARAATRRADRKSTRLNSSHSQISYAVFCLKKKKQKSVRHCMTVS